MEESAPLPGLNKEQQAIVSCLDVHQIVAAGPGTGKTRTMVHWIHHILESGKARASEILAVTFTNKAADELKSRVKKLSGTRAELVVVETFHSFVYAWIENHSDQKLKILDNLKRYKLIEALNPELTARQAAQLTREINLFYGQSKPVSSPLQSAFEKYKSYLQNRNILDLSEMVSWFCDYLEAHEQELITLRQSIKYLAVDELQDIDQSQYRLIKQLCGPGGPVLLAIGDPDQGIYGFRGADISHFFNLVHDLALEPKALTRNYRSEKDILDAASQLIGHNSVRLNIFPQAVKKGTLGNISIYEAPDDEAEARFIAKTIEQLIGGIDLTSQGLDFESKLSFSDVAILYRSRQTGRHLYKLLSRYHLPINPVDDVPLLLQEPFRGIYLKLAYLADPGDGAAFFEIFCQEHQVIALEDVEKLMIQGLPAIQLLDQLENWVCREKAEAFDRLWTDLKLNQEILESKGLEFLLESLLVELENGEDLLVSFVKDELLKQARSFSKDLNSFLRQVLLSPFESAVKFNQDRIAMLTFHSAKGLEFPVVFIPALEQGLVPLARAENMEEERRLFYVALTRAQDKIYMSWARQRFLWRKRKVEGRSPFVDEFSPELLKNISGFSTDHYFQPKLF